jgi:peptide/nickel transport system substrate-binding protein
MTIGGSKRRLGFNAPQIRYWGLIAFLALTSCQSPNQSPNQSQNQSQSDRNQRITFGTTASISTIDPADAYSSAAGLLLYNLSDRLYTYKPGTQDLIPQLATALPTVSADGLIYKIPLRQGVTFHDGEPFNAKAMGFSLDRFIKNKGAPAFLLGDAIDSIQVSGEYELTINLKKPFTAFTSLLAFSGACAVSPKAYTIQEGEFKAKEFVGTGPYKLVSFGVDRIRLEPFVQYWGEKPANQGVDIQIYSSPPNLFNAFRTGAVDLAFKSLAIEQIELLQKESQTQGWQVIDQAGTGIDYLSLNVKSAPLDRLEVRQAIAAAIDRPFIQGRVFNQQVNPVYSLIPSTLPEQVPSFKANYGEAGNPQKAKRLLMQAGFSTANPLTLELWYRSNLPKDQLAMITIKALLQKSLGNLVKLNLNGVDSATAYKNLDKGVYPTFMLDWTPDYLDADSYIQPFVDCTKGTVTDGCAEGSTPGQGSFYFNDRVNQLIAESRKVRDPKQRQVIFSELQAIVAREVPFIPLWQGRDYLFAQKGIQGASLEATQKVSFSRLKK